MKALIDGDILRYEVGFAAETGWQTEDELPPWEYVADMFDHRVNNIIAEAGADDYLIYLSGKENFRNDVAVTKPYKGTRKDHKPYHFSNISAYIIGAWKHVITDGIEADDLMAIDQVQANHDEQYEGDADADYRTIICSRDKDLRQVPGWHYGWEIGKQASFGPFLVEDPGAIHLTDDKPKKLKGWGLKFFYSQLITGDTVDNIPGLPGVGVVGAYKLIGELEHMSDIVAAVVHAYLDAGMSSAYLLEQGQLLWMVRRRHEDGSPVMWKIGMTK